MGSARINAIRQRLGVKKGLPKPGTPEGDDLVNRITKKLMGIQKKQDQIDPRRGNPLGMRGDITTPLIKEVPFGPEKYPLGAPDFGDAKAFDHIDSNLLL